MNAQFAVIAMLAGLLIALAATKLPTSVSGLSRKRKASRMPTGLNTRGSAAYI